MLTMSDLFDPVLYRLMIEQGYIKERQHPEFPNLFIVNYTEKCVWENVWNEITLQCRGIIYSMPSGTVIARPFSKFFNYGQPGAPVIELTESVRVTDKMDGSLGILYHAENVGRPAIATRGSFASDQAVWATELFREKYNLNKFLPRYGWTYLFEIIYPENRIVVDYGEFADLVLIGAVDTESGRSLPLELVAEGWPGPVATIFPARNLAEALAMEPRRNVEGVVIHAVRRDVRIKLKQEDYILLHKFMTRTNPKHVWEVMIQGLDPYEFFKEAPDEFHEWLKDVITDFQMRFDQINDSARKDYQMTIVQLPQEFSRKDYALQVQSSEYKAILFRLFDNKPYDDIIWKMLKPSGADVHAIREVNPDAD